MKSRNFSVVFIGAILMAAGFLGVLFIGQIINPPATGLMVAKVEIPVGTVITADMLAVDQAQVHSKVAQNVVLESELDQYVGSVAIEPIHIYEYLPKMALSKEGNPAAGKRLALALADPNLVAMVVPVDQKTSPDLIVAGDYVDLGFGSSANTQNGERLSTAPTEMPGQASGYGGEYGAAATPTPAEALEPTATQTPEPLLVMPIAKTIVSSAKVLAIVRDEKTATQVDSQGQSQTVAVPGKMLALVVAVPREAQELVQFAVDNGQVRVALLSAQVQNGSPLDREPTLGMTWNDLVSLMRMEREAALADGLPTVVIGPGAYAVEATRNAATQAVVAETQASIRATQKALTATPTSAARPDNALAEPTATPKK